MKFFFSIGSFSIGSSHSIEKEFQVLCHEILNGIVVIKGLIKPVSKRINPDKELTEDERILEEIALRCISMEKNISEFVERKK